jgi:Asp-tRNA(Asn)/Glu-tRNA(Gln) amidotransferase A subunit family amidase
LLSASATDIAAAIRKRAISAIEVTDSYLANIEAVNPRINAIVTLAPHAREAALAVDTSLPAMSSPSPLVGVPFTVKDNLATAGLRTTGGSTLLADFVPSESAPAVRRLERAGAVLLGKTNCPEFAIELDTTNDLFGPTLNPLDSNLTPGGSSGGESAALAAGLSALGLGTDYGASIRWPAQCTGVVSIRPTVGRVPTTGMLPYFTAEGLAPPDPLSFFAQASVVAPMARSIWDLWEALRILAGPDAIDMAVVQAPLPESPKTDVHRLRCAWFVGEGSYPVRSDVAKTVEAAAVALEDRGLLVECAFPRALERAEETYSKLRIADNGAWMSRLPKGPDGRRPPKIEAAIAESRRVPIDDYQKAAAERASIRRELLRFMEVWPILLMPVSSVPAFSRGTKRFLIEGLEVSGMGIVACSRVISLAGFPAASVPCGTSEEGAPISVQVVGRPFAENDVLVVAATLEEIFGKWGSNADSPVRRSVPT